MVGVGGGGLVGRSAELARLTASVDRLDSGRGGLAWIHGEPGSGKSALVDAMTARAVARGCLVVRGAGDELSQPLPLRLMADMLRVHPHSADPAAAAVARLLRGDTSGSGAADPVLAAIERLQELVDRRCAAGPVLLVAEDLHWADEPSLLLWNRLARAVGQIPLLLVGTARPAPHRAIVTTLADLVAARGGAAVALSALSGAEVRQLAARDLGAAPGPRLSAELSRAGGNPLYVRELVAALAGDGVITAGGVAEFHGEPGVVPESLADAIRRRIRFPDAGTLNTMRIAALLGNDFGLDELEIGTGRSAAELSAVAEEAIAAGVLRPSGTRLAFRHELIRQVLVGQASPATRSALHRHLARELAAAGRGIDLVARQLLAVPGTPDPWVAGWLAGLPEPMLLAVPQAAADLLDRTLPAIGPGDAVWVPLASRAARAAFWLGRDERAGRLALEVARHADPETATRMAILAQRAAGRSGRLDEAVAIASAPVPAGASAAARATMSAGTAVTFAEAGSPDRAAAGARRARELADRSGDRLAIGYARHASAVVEAVPEVALDHVDAALAVLADDAESTDLRLLLTNNRLTYLAVLGRWERALDSLPAALVLAERAGTFRATGLLATAAEVCYLCGAWDEAVIHLRGVDAALLGNTSNLNPAALGALIALHRGDRDTAEAYLQDAGPPDPRALANWRLTAAWALRAEVNGDEAGAVALMRGWLDLSPPPGQHTRQEMMPRLVRLALSTGDRALAEHVVATCRADAEAHARHADTTVWDEAVRCGQAQLDDDAPALLESAAAYRAGRWPAQSALAFEEAAVRLAGTGDTAGARSALAEAARILIDLGADWDLRRAEARMRGLGVRRGPRSAHRRVRHGWDALTPAESRIAKLVAQGMSNPDIAGELYLSRRTVQTHVSNILGKLGLNSRLEIMREASPR